MKFRMWNGCDRGLCCKAVGRQDRQLNTYDWLADVPGNAESTDLVEVQFKNTRKGYYHNVNNLDLKKGDIVAVEANPGHDVGVVTLTGRLVKLQIKKANLKSQDDIKRIYRLAKQVDLDKAKEAKSHEHDTMIQSRQIAKDLGLKMKSAMWSIRAMATRLSSTISLMSVWISASSSRFLPIPSMSVSR